MAKRSDFAQKLLDDLRVRKERMAAAQSSNRSNTTETGSRTGNAYNRPNGGNRSISVGEASKHIVPFERGHGSERIDLSMALAFALENGGKLRRMDSSGNSSMLNFLHQIGRGSVEFGKVERRSTVDWNQPSSSHFPILSHLHIKEISKGAHKLNQILKVCSNGLNFDRYSVEMAQELMKGAMDLEESLRMLVNLQEASDYMINPQRKNKITLLEDDDDNDDNTVTTEQKQLDRPIFSFDKTSRNSHTNQEVARTGINQRLAALTYPKDASNSNHEKQALITSNSVSHTRSASYGSDVKNLAAFTEQKNQSNSSKSKSEKGRIPSVIVKLMGLDELPENVDSKYTTRKDSGSRQKFDETALKVNVQGSTRTAEKNTNLAEQPVKQKVIQANKIPVVQDPAAVLQAEKHPATRYASFELVLHDRKPLWKDLEATQPVPSSADASVKVKQHSNITLLNRNTGRQKDVTEKERKQDNTKQREQKGKEKSGTKESLIKNELQQMTRQKRLEAAVIMQEKTEYKASMLLTEKRNANKLVTVNQQQKPHGHLGNQQPYILQKSEHREEKHQAEEKEQQRAKQKLQVRKQKGKEVLSKILSKPRNDAINLHKKQQHINQVRLSKKGPREPIDAIPSKWFQDNRHHEDLVKGGNSINLHASMKDSTKRNADKSSSLKYLESEPYGAPPVEEENLVHAAVTQKATNMEVHKNKIPCKMDEVMIRRNGAPDDLTKPLKPQSSILQEFKEGKNDILSGPRGAEQMRASKSKEAEARIMKSDELEARIQPPNMAQLQASTLCVFVGDECLSVKEPETLSPNDRNQTMTPIAVKDQQGQASVLGREELKFDEILSNTINGTQGGKGISYPSELKRKKITKPAIVEPLTERETQLKQIVMKSQLFLDTAEALLKLNISFVILDADGHDGLNEDDRLVLDCGYELMKRKGTRQELSVHPCVKISVTSTKIISLDDLVKQLNKDFEMLKLYGRNGKRDCNAEDYLPKMLESDIHDRYPDMNCMWDVDWDENMLAFLEKDDVVRDVERHVFNGLIDEITRDLLYV